jgi:beta-galactosidase/beta-glucuronidase
MSARFVFKSFVILAVVVPMPSLWATDRTTISLNGTWQIEDSKEAEAIPVAWHRTVPVPGLAHSSEPAFSQVDQFDSRMLIQNRVSQGKLPKSAIVYNAGVSQQDRNWFWYRRTFELSDTKSVAILRINKAQFGAAAWLNGVKVGDHLPCFTAAIFDVSKAIRRGQNELTVRVGAHPGVLPPSVSGGTDFEKIRWTPGIYDNVSLALSDNPAIENVQVAPKIADSSVLV